MANSKKKDSDIIEAEIIDELEGAQPMTISQALEKSLAGEIKKFNPYEKRVAELKQAYCLEKLPVKDIKDKEGRENLRLAIADLREMWVQTEEDRKAINGPIIAAKESIDTKAKWIISELKSIAKPLQERQDALKAEEEEISRRKKEAENARFITRTAELTKMGADFDGQAFRLEGVSYDGSVVRGTDEDIYQEDILPKFKEIFERKESVRIEQDKIAAEQARVFKEQQDALAKAQEELREAQEKLRLDQQKAEKEKKDKDEADRKNLISARLKQLTDLGLVFDFSDNHYKNFDCFVPMLDITGYDEKKWNNMIEIMIPHIQEFKERKRLADEEYARLEENKRLEHIEQVKQDAAKKALEDAAEEKRLSEVAEQERLEQAKDKEKWEAVVKHLKATPLLDMRSSQYRTKMRNVRDWLAGIDEI